jgi:hypothetical protein
MANFNVIDTNDTYISAYDIASKYCDDDNIEVFSIRDYLANIDSLLDKIEKINQFGVNNYSEETLARTEDIVVSRRFILDVVKSTIVQHIKDMKESYEYCLRSQKLWNSKHFDTDEVYKLFEKLDIHIEDRFNGDILEAKKHISGLLDEIKDDENNEN